MFKRYQEPNPIVTPVVLVLNDVYWTPYVLASIDGWFKKIVIYDAGSTDGTIEAIRHFEKSSNSELLIEEFPLVPPKAQLCYRNAAIADAGSEFYMIVDGDEVWTQEALMSFHENLGEFLRARKLYGVVHRVEVKDPLDQAYSQDKFLPHHRLYHRSCTWRGTHPGERPTIPQKKGNEFRFPIETKVYHFHNTVRSPIAAPKREVRKGQKTYHRGEISSINLLEEVPILRNRINPDLPINPNLEILQRSHAEV